MNSYPLLPGAAYAVIHNSFSAVTLHKPQGSPALARHLPTHTAGSPSGKQDPPREPDRSCVSSSAAMRRWQDMIWGCCRDRKDANMSRPQCFEELCPTPLWEVCAASEIQTGKVQFVFRRQFSISHSFIMGIY